MSVPIVGKIVTEALESVPFAAGDILGGNPVQKAKVLFQTQENRVCGIWECSPGQFKEVPVAQNETFAILQGQARIRLGDGDETLVQAGDVVTIPKGSAAFWKVEKTIRKAFVKY